MSISKEQNLLKEKYEKELENKNNKIISSKKEND